MSGIAAAIANKLSKAQREVIVTLLLEAPKLLSHRESVSTLAMERVQVRPFIFAQLTIHGYARGATYYDTTPTGRLTPLGDQIKNELLARHKAKANA